MDQQTGGGWLKRATINPSIAHSILSYNTNNHRAGVDNYVCKELPLDTPVEDIRKIMGIKGREKKIGNIYGATGGNYAGNVYDDNYLAPSISTCGGGNQQPMIIDGVKIRQATEQGYIECEYGGLADLSMPNSETRRGRVQGGENISPTLVSGSLEGIHRIESPYRIRKLTPRECWRLMAFTDEEFDKAAEVNSQSQLYKQAGNSIVVDVLSVLFTEIIKAEDTTRDHKGEQISIFDLL